jgi:RNA polymerase sigma factor (sigma-70 family)
MNVQQSEQILLGGFARTFQVQERTLDHVFEDLFIAHYPRLVKTLIRLVGDPGQAEELAADTFYRLHQNRPPGTPDSLAGWLYRTAMNLGLDALRTNARRARREDFAGREALRKDEPGSPLHHLLAEEERGRVRTVLALLKPEYSQALLMNSSGFTCKEMSGVLGMKTDSLYVLLGRARAKFEQEYLKIYGGQQ